MTFLAIILIQRFLFGMFILIIAIRFSLETRSQVKHQYEHGLNEVNTKLCQNGQLIT
jgi:hypothetical protein